jgi:hypothetical protein
VGADLHLALLVAVAAGLMVCLANWRAGVLLTLAVGFLQEPVRKLLPEQPVWLQLAVGLFFVVTLVGCAMRYGGLRLSPIARQHPLVGRPVRLFLWLTVLYLGLTLVRFQNLRLFGIGAISYVFPLLAALLGYYYGQSAERVRRYVLWHAAFTVAFAAGIYLDYLGVRSPLFEEVGPGVPITVTGAVLKGFCGLFRASEIAGWHIGATICFLSMVIIASRRVAVRGGAAVVILALAGAAVLTGRRKVIMLLLLYVTLLGFVLLYFRARIRHGYAVILLVAGLATSLVWGRFFQIQPERTEYGFYVGRSGTVIRDSPERLRMLGLGSIVWSLQDNGLFGSGAGVAGQGAQYYGGGVDVTGGGGEGGLGRITAEFGAPGLALVLWLLVSLAREAWRTLRRAAAARGTEAAYVICLIAFLAANVPVFVVASQAYGDPFIIYTLSMAAGCACALAGPLFALPAAAGAAVAPAADRPRRRPALASERR